MSRFDRFARSRVARPYNHAGDENGANATSAARVTVEADGQVLFSELVKRKDKPKGLVLAVKGVKQLRIIVEADTPLNGNYVTLADARVQK